jgi:hypothetical protein
MNRTQTVNVEGRVALVSFMSGRPWYVRVVSPATGFNRTIWHRDNHRDPGPMARAAIEKCKIVKG